MQIQIPKIKNPGFGFTSNTREMLQDVVSFFSSFPDCTIPYQEFRAAYGKGDNRREAKIRMLFPLLRKGGCLQIDSSKLITISNGSFLSSLGKEFFYAWSLYQRLLNAISNGPSTFSNENLLRLSMYLYQSIAELVFENLSSSSDIYRHLKRFADNYQPISRREVQILLYVLNRGAAVEGDLSQCKCDERELSDLITSARKGILTIVNESHNNATQYYSSIMVSLLLWKEENGKFISMKKETF